jgi:predicted DNA-binding transcriptional regulator AlpA
MSDRAALRERDAATYLGLSRMSLRRHGPKPLKIGRCVLYPVTMLDAWLASHTQQMHRATADEATERAVNAIRQARDSKARRRKP